MPSRILKKSELRFPSQVFIGYLAGLFDGKGNLSYRPRLYVFEITNTNKSVVRYLQRNLNGGTVTKQEYPDDPKRNTAWKFGGIVTKQEYPDDPKRNTAWKFRLSSINEVLHVLWTIFPFLIVKEKDALEAIRYLEERKAAIERVTRDFKPISKKQKIWQKKWRTKHLNTTPVDSKVETNDE